MLKRRASQAGIKDFSPHDFRRTFIGDELDNGTDMVTVSSDVGHSSVNTTAKYDRRGFRSQLEAAKKRKTPYVPHKSLETGGNTDD